MVHDAPVDALAARIAADWGELTHTAVVAMIANLYTDLIVVPPSWPTHRRHTLVTEAANTTATELSAAWVCGTKASASCAVRAVIGWPGDARVGVGGRAHCGVLLGRALQMSASAPGTRRISSRAAAIRGPRRVGEHHRWRRL